MAVSNIITHAQLLKDSYVSAQALRFCTSWCVRSIETHSLRFL